MKSWKSPVFSERQSRLSLHQQRKSMYLSCCNDVLSKLLKWSWSHSRAAPPLGSGGRLPPLEWGCGGKTMFLPSLKISRYLMKNTYLLKNDQRQEHVPIKHWPLVPTCSKEFCEWRKIFVDKILWLSFLFNPRPWIFHRLLGGHLNAPPPPMISAPGRRREKRKAAFESSRKIISKSFRSFFGSGQSWGL